MDRANSKVTRRQFIGRAAGAAAAFTIVPRYVLGGAKFVAPSEKVNIAVIGCGGQGRTNARGLFGEKDAQIVAIADPNEQADYSRYYYEGVAGRLPVKAEVEKQYSQDNPQFKCNDYVDFRELLDKEKNIDAILCATPDHWHACVTVAAIHRGKHVYCEKPLTHNIYEARTVAKAAEEAGVATQMGNQGRSDEGNQLTCEMVWDGAIGEVREVHAWSRPAAGRAVAADRRTRRRCPRASTGNCGSGPSRTDPIIRRMPLTTGAAGGSSAPAASAIWPSTTSTRRSRR